MTCYFRRHIASSSAAIALATSLVTPAAALAQARVYPEHSFSLNRVIVPFYNEQETFPSIVVEAYRSDSSIAVIQETLKLPAASFPAETEEERLDRVTYHLSAASADKCTRPTMLTGMSLHDAASYDAADRLMIEKSFHLGMGFGIRHVIPQSAAALGGIAAGDVVTAVNGISMGDFNSHLVGNTGRYDRVAIFESFLEDSLARGPAQLTIQRDTTTVNISVVGESGCGGRSVLYDKGGLNAWSDGKYVAVTAKMMKFSANDDELAFVIAHELAHNILNHARKLKGKSLLMAELGIGSRVIKKTEIEADELGTEIMLMAGYNMDGAISLLERARSKIPLDLGITHPGITRRQQNVLATAERFKPLQVAGQQSKLAIAVLASATNALAAFSASIDSPVVPGIAKLGNLDIDLVSKFPSFVADEKLSLLLSLDLRPNAFIGLGVQCHTGNRECFKNGNKLTISDKPFTG